MPEERFTSHLPAVLAATTATVIATIGTSALGYGGTILGVTLGSLVTGSGAWVAERWLRRWSAVAKAKAEAMKRKGRPLTDTETQMIKRVVDQRYQRVRGLPWKLMSLSAASVFALVVAVIAVIELTAGKPVSAVVRNEPASGFVAPVAQSTPSTAPPSPSVTRSAAPTSAAPSLTASPSPSQTVQPSASQTVAPSSPAITVTPSPSMSSSVTAVPTP